MSVTRVQMAKRQKSNRTIQIVFQEQKQDKIDDRNKIACPNKNQVRFFSAPWFVFNIE